MMDGDSSERRARLLREDVSPDTLERLVARAEELDTSRANRISLTRAREIASELGISQAAWDAAVAERGETPARSIGVRRSHWGGWPTLLVAAAGFAAGMLGVVVNRAFAGDLDVLYSAPLIAGGLLAWSRSRGRGDDSTHALDAWWIAVPAGMLAAFGEVKTDPLLFAAFARWGTGAFVARLPQFKRWFREAASRTTSTA